MDYCRVRYFQGNVPMVELNMRYFDLKFPDINYRQRILKLFPKDVQKGYILYR
uniref:Portal protein n=1 Tax=Siphoviridae sp. ct2D011 TaxID=2825314 RepID=A0A8S5V981_9CAUD|nr:MAG TPA: portal protein [Siphoviridae sp. ct2D011]